LYERRFLERMRKRLAATGRYTGEELARPRSLWEIDDFITAPSFGFGTAENYYATQSANRFLECIRVPTLVIAAQDDPLIPFEMYSHAAFRTNPCLKLVAPEHGGHLGFLARRKPRFWADETVVEWMESERTV
jgi:predicted alpha/beta-fold hydrolase